MRQRVQDKEEQRQLAAQLMDADNSALRLKALVSQMDSSLKISNERTHRLSDMLDQRSVNLLTSV